MKKNRGNTKGLPQSAPGLPREYIECLAAGNPDSLFVQLSIPSEVVANTLLAETTENHLLLDLSNDDLLNKIARSGELISICTKEELSPRQSAMMKHCWQRRSGRLPRYSGRSQRTSARMRP